VLLLVGGLLLMGRSVAAQPPAPFTVTVWWWQTTLTPTTLHYRLYLNPPAWPIAPVGPGIELQQVACDPVPRRHRASLDPP
jgi:hypothetical protein